MTTVSDVREPSLFDGFDIPKDWLPVRSCDPETSRYAATRIDHKERKREVLAAMRVLNRPAPASEIQRQMWRMGVVREIGSIRSRLSQLRTDRVVRNTGGVRTVPVDQGGTGRPEQLWELA